MTSRRAATCRPLLSSADHMSLVLQYPRGQRSSMVAVSSWKSMAEGAARCRALSACVRAVFWSLAKRKTDVPKCVFARDRDRSEGGICSEGAERPKERSLEGGRLGDEEGKWLSLRGEQGVLAREDTGRGWSQYRSLDGRCSTKFSLCVDRQRLEWRRQYYGVCRTKSLWPHFVVCVP